MDTTAIAAALCRQYEVRPTSGGLSVVSPLRYDDGDRVVLFIASADGQYIVDDNGEAAMRLMTEGVDLDAARVQQWLAGLPAIRGVAWDGEEEHLVATTRDANALADAVMRVAECSIQMQALAALRVERTLSDFKEQVVALLREVAEETGVDARYDVPVDQDQQLYADVYFASATPLAVVVAPNVPRLLEAELMWMNARRMGDPTKVIAVVEDANKIGVKQYTRANYFTDKTVSFMAGSFRALVKSTLAH